MKKRFRRRAAIEPVIGHLESDFRLARNYLKGSVGDSLNLMLATAAWNFRNGCDKSSLYGSKPSGFLTSDFLLWLHHNQFLRNDYRDTMKKFHQQ